MRNNANQAASRKLGEGNDREFQDMLRIEAKKLYMPPILVRQAHVRDITLGSTGGPTESGGNGDGWHWEQGQSEPANSEKSDGIGKIFESNIFGE